jgi:A/G-specific adenine glycosylase
VSAEPTPEELDPDRLRERISRPLLAWFRAEQRDLPWRRDADPYAVWVSEIMLQQTQVATVIPYFERWMARFPTVHALASAEEDEVLHAWQGLGYYSRARNLLRAAREVVARHRGRIPDSVEELRTLPGVGRYTAGAIASIAYNRPAPIVDGNVQRVLTRLFALGGDPRRAPLEPRLWHLAELLIPERAARDFNPALMELGARICVPVNPRCGICPVALACEARRLGIQDQFPETAPRPKTTPVRMAAALVRCGDRLLIVQRRADESRWAGMWQFPSVELTEGETGVEAARRAARDTVGLDVRPGARAAVLQHSVTRFRITLEAFECEPLEGTPRAAGCQAWSWVEPARLTEYALPAAHRRIADRLLRAGGGEEAQLALGFGG